MRRFVQLNLLPRSTGKKRRHPRRSISKNLRFYPVIAIPAVDSNGMRSEIDTYILRDTECVRFPLSSVKTEIAVRLNISAQQKK
jgi:hypothetical protein